MKGEFIIRRKENGSVMGKARRISFIRRLRARAREVKPRIKSIVMSGNLTAEIIAGCMETE